MYKALCLFRDQFDHIKPVEKELAGIFEFIYDNIWDIRNIDKIHPDIVIGINEHHLDIAKCYQRANELNIPTLTLQDGILEWRHLFENPLFNGNKSGVPLHLPVLADKIACIGPIWYYIISKMGNANKVELTGMPKMDKVVNSKIILRSNCNCKKRVLIMSSATPWFYENQKPTVIRMFLDLKDYFKEHTEFEPWWRVSKLLENELNVENKFNKKESGELKNQLDNCDAVISTISTSMIESMICGKPVAKIDYFNNPSLFLTVWNITDKSQIDKQVHRLLNPTNIETWLQDSYKDLMILETNNASKNVATLIQDMVSYKKSRPKDDLPKNLFNKFNNKGTEEYFIRIEKFFPERKILGEKDNLMLKQMLMRSELEIYLLRKKLDNLSISKRIMRFVLKRLLKRSVV